MISFLISCSLYKEEYRSLNMTRILNYLKREILYRYFDLKIRRYSLTEKQILQSNQDEQLLFYPKKT